MSFHDDCYTSLEDAEAAKEPLPSQHVELEPLRFDWSPEEYKMMQFLKEMDASLDYEDAELAKEPDPCQHVVMPVRFVDEEPKPAKPCRSHDCEVDGNMKSVPIDPAIQARVSKILDDKEAMYRQSDLSWRGGFAAGMVFTTAFGFFVFVAGYVIACLV